MTVEIPAAVLDESVVRSVLWFYGLPGGLQSGSFMNALMTAFSKADPENFLRLEVGFPVLAYWVRTLRFQEDGATLAVRALDLLGVTA